MLVCFNILSCRVDAILEFVNNDCIDHSDAENTLKLDAYINSNMEKQVGNVFVS